MDFALAQNNSKLLVGAAKWHGKVENPKLASERSKTIFTFSVILNNTDIFELPFAQF